MHNSQTKSRPFSRLGKIILLILLFCVFICSSSLYFLLVLPSVISLESIENIIEKNSRTVLNIPLEVGDIQCGWLSGFQILGLRIQGAGNHDPISILQIDEVASDISVSDIFHGRINFSLYVKGAAFNLVRYADGKTNIDSMITPQDTKSIPRQPGETKPKPLQTDSRPFSLPLDVGVKIELRDMAVSVNDQITGKQLFVDKGLFILDSPSIRFQKIGLKLYMDMAIDDRQLPPVDLILTAANIIDPETAAVTPEKIDVSLDGKLPGSILSVDGRPFGKGLISDVHVDLRALHAAVSPFLPPLVASSQFEGVLDISTRLHVKSQNVVAFDSSVKLDRINISGPVIQGREVKGFHAGLFNIGEIDLSSQQLNISEGKLSILRKNEFHYHGILNSINQAAQDSILAVDTASVDINELLTFGASFLPPDFPVQLGGDKNSPVLQLTGAVLQGNFSTGACIGRIEMLHLDFPDIQVKDKNRNIRVTDTRFDLYQLTSDLKQYFPVDVRFDSSLKIDKIAVDTTEKIIVQNISVPKFRLQIKDIQKNPKALFGYAATLSGIQNLSIQKIQIPSIVEVDSVRQKLDASCRLLPEEKISVGIKEISIGVSNLMIQHDTVGTFQTGVDMDGSIAELNINGLKPTKLDVIGFQNRVNIGDFVELNVMNDIRDMGVQAALTRGDLSINLGNLFQRLAAKPEQVSLLDGTVRLRWDINARRPAPSEIEVLQKKSVTDLQKDFPFIHSIHTDLTLNHINTNVTINPELGFHLEDVSGEPLLQYDYDGKIGKGRYAGNLSLHNVASTSIPAFDQPAAMKLFFSGTHDGLKKLSLSQNLEIASMGLKESVHLTLSGLDQSVLRNKEKNLPYFLKKTGGSFSGEITVADLSRLNQVQKSVTAGGSFNAGLNLLLVPGSRLGGKTWIQVIDVDLEKEEHYSVRDFSGNIHLEKEYRLTENMTASLNVNDYDSSSNLSDRVMGRADIQERPFPSGYPGANGRYPLQREYPYREMMIRFTSADSEKGPLPIALQHFQTGIELVEGLPRIHNFQVDLLGGTIISSVSVQKRDKRFYVPITVSFSGIQTDRFWGNPVATERKKDTEISGQVYAYFPVTTDIDDFLNNLKVDILFTDIGNLALDQLLYSLDPTESNEKIVSQRKLVQKGSPKWMRLTITDGALSLEGVVTVEGVDIDIPQVRRLNISRLSGLDPLEDGLLKLSPVIGILHSMSANTIWMDREKNEVGFIQ